jgi:5-(carboxyamino)imidazole ribonucleotide mutase
MQVLILLGSASDAPVAEKAMGVFAKLGVQAKAYVASAHRTPERVEKLVKETDADVFIAVAGLSAALPGVVAAMTIKPVIGVPVSGKLNLDAILSVVQMPPHIPVAAVGLDRGENAALLAASILALSDEKLARALTDYRNDLKEKVERDSKAVEAL